MLHKSLTLLLLMIPLLLASQESDTINQVDTQGKKTGYWEKKSPEGSYLYQGYFKEGRPIGEMKRYYETGELKAVMFYKEDCDTVRTRFFYNDGEPAGEGSYLGNQKEGLWTYYSFYSGAVTSTEQYVHGQRHGTERKFYSNGQVSEEIEWSRNVKHGQWNQFFEDGTRKLLSFHLYGKVSGSYTFYWPNSYPYYKGQFLDNKQHGKWEFYTDEGELKYEIMYHYGKAENEEELIKQDQEFFEMIEENLGKFEDPTIEDVMPGGGEYY